MKGNANARRAGAVLRGLLLGLLCLPTLATAADDPGFVRRLQDILVERFNADPWAPGAASSEAVLLGGVSDVLCAGCREAEASPRVTRIPRWPSLWS